MIICICGKSGSGKTTFSKKLQEKFVRSIYINVDDIAHKVLEKESVKQKIRKYFGNDLIIDNMINRKKLGRIVFHSKEANKYFEEITWPYMEEEIDNLIADNQEKIILLDYILLPKTKYFKKAPYRILLDIPLNIRRERILMRDHIDDEYFNIRDNACDEYDYLDFNYILHDDEEMMNFIKNINIKNL